MKGAASVPKCNELVLLHVEKKQVKGAERERGKRSKEEEEEALAECFAGLAACLSALRVVAFSRVCRNYFSRFDQVRGKK